MDNKKLEVMWQVVDRIISMFIFLGVNVFANEYKFFDGTCYEYNTLFRDYLIYGPGAGISQL